MSDALIPRSTISLPDASGEDILPSSCIKSVETLLRIPEWLLDSLEKSAAAMGELCNKLKAPNRLNLGPGLAAANYRIQYLNTIL